MQDFELLFYYIEQHVRHSGGLRPQSTGCWLVLPRSGAIATRQRHLLSNFAFFSRAHLYVLLLLLLYICAAVRAVVRVALCVVRCVVTISQSLCGRAFRCVVGCVVACVVGCAVGCVVDGSMSAASNRLVRQTPAAHGGKVRRAATGKRRGAAQAGDMQAEPCVEEPDGALAAAVRVRVRLLVFAPVRLGAWCSVRRCVGPARAKAPLRGSGLCPPYRRPCAPSPQPHGCAPA